MARIRVAHLAPEVPTADDTSVDFVIVDEGSFTAVGFAEVSGYVTLPPDAYFLDVLPAGTSGEPLASTVATLARGGVYTVVAYRDSGESSLTNLFMFEQSTNALAVDRGRVVMANGADDSSWQVVNVVDADTDVVLVSDLLFGTQSDPSDISAGELSFGFDVVPPSPAIDEGPFSAEVVAGEYSILIAVDNDTVDGSVDPSVYAIGPMTEDAITPLPPSTP